MGSLQPTLLWGLDWWWSWNSNTVATWWEELTHLKRPWCWEWLKAGGEGDDRGWDDCMASPTQWTWVWVSSWSWWWTARPGVLQSMGLQRVRHDWVTELSWTELKSCDGSWSFSRRSCLCFPSLRAEEPQSDIWVKAVGIQVYTSCQRGSCWPPGPMFQCGMWSWPWGWMEQGITKVFQICVVGREEDVMLMTVKGNFQGVSQGSCIVSTGHWLLSPLYWILIKSWIKPRFRIIATCSWSEGTRGTRSVHRGHQVGLVHPGIMMTVGEWSRQNPRVPVHPILYAHWYPPRHSLCARRWLLPFYSDRSQSPEKLRSFPKTMQVAHIRDGNPPVLGCQPGPCLLRGAVSQDGPDQGVCLFSGVFATRGGLVFLWGGEVWVLTGGPHQPSPVSLTLWGTELAPERRTPPSSCPIPLPRPSAPDSRKHMIVLKPG